MSVVSSVLSELIKNCVRDLYPATSDDTIGKIAEKALGYLRFSGNSSDRPCRILCRFEYPINHQRTVFFFCDVIAMDTPSSFKILQCAMKLSHTGEDVEHLMEDTSIPKIVTISGTTFILSDELIRGMEGNRDQIHIVDLAELVGALHKYKKRKSVRKKLQTEPKTETQVKCYCKDSQERTIKMVIRQRPGEKPAIITAFYVN